jgi:hypothetical protein
VGVIITRMVMNMNETRRRTIAQLQKFLTSTSQVEFLASGEGDVGDAQRYEHVSRSTHGEQTAPPTSGIH